MILLILLILLCIGIYCFTNYNVHKNSTYYQNTNNSYYDTVTDVGKYGKYLTYYCLKNFENDDARFLFNCYLPTKNGETTEIDVLMIHRSGIYVFE